MLGLRGWSTTTRRHHRTVIPFCHVPPLTVGLQDHRACGPEHSAEYSELPHAWPLVDRVWSASSPGIPQPRSQVCAVEQRSIESCCYLISLITLQILVPAGEVSNAQ